MNYAHGQRGRNRQSKAFHQPITLTTHTLVDGTLVDGTLVDGTLVDDTLVDDPFSTSNGL